MCNIITHLFYTFYELFYSVQHGIKGYHKLVKLISIACCGDSCFKVMPCNILGSFYGFDHRFALQKGHDPTRMIMLVTLSRKYIPNSDV